MTLVDHQTLHKPFTPGTTGWSVEDLDNPAIESQWLGGRYEIIEGVLTIMPPAYFYGHECAANLLLQLQLFARQHRLGGSFAFEVDIVLNPRRIVRGDVAYLSPGDRSRQKAAAQELGQTDLRRTRILVPPTLLVEATSVGHESHDRRTKFAWYAEFGIPHYWILDPLGKSLECWMLRGGEYVKQAAGRDAEEVETQLFPGLRINLGDVWGQD